VRIVAACNWPEHLRPWLMEMRIRIGSGPSGEAASERRVIEVPDVDADPALKDWQEAAHELGARALIALPLLAGPKVLGVATFYFAAAEGFSAVQRDLCACRPTRWPWLSRTRSWLSGHAERCRECRRRVRSRTADGGRARIAAGPR